MKEKNYQGEGCNYREYPYHEPARGNGSSAHDVHRRVKALGYKNVNKALADHVEEDDLTKRYPIVDNLGRRQKGHLNQRERTLRADPLVEAEEGQKLLSYLAFEKK